MEIKKCSMAEVPSVLALADDVFLKSRNREGDFLKSYPSVFGKQSNSVFYAAFENSKAVSAALYKPCRYMLNDQVLTGATIGFVCTDPAYRGLGLSSQILSRTAEDMAESGVDFGVLYTGIPAFYERLGWILADDSAYCESAKLVNVSAEHTVIAQSPQQADWTWLEYIRAKYLKQRVLRNQSDYATLPLPAKIVECYAIKDGGPECYALLGRSGAEGYLYEMVGDTAGFGILWNSFIQGLSSLYVNDRIGSSSYVWMRDNGLADWVSRVSTMWLPVSHRLPYPHKAGIHLHYLDHI